MKRPEILDAAKKCVCGQREEDYGKPERNFQTIADFWNSYLDAAHPELNLKDVAECVEVPAIITPKDVAMMMALLKVARAANGDKPDNFVDLAGYAACGGEIATQGSAEDLKMEAPDFVKANQCLICGDVIPEGRQVCPNCEAARNIPVTG